VSLLDAVGIVLSRSDARRLSGFFPLVWNITNEGELRVSDLRTAIEMILVARRRIPAHESLLVAVSGIDASGKGFVTGLIVDGLHQQGLNAVSVNIDAWLDLPSRRFNRDQPAEHFYRHAIRFEEMFERLILPLKQRRSIRVEADLVEETASVYHQYVYEFQSVDVIVLEGIYLLKRTLREHYDLAFWVECSFETALVRALRRTQEGLPLDATIHAYQTIYFPAQYIHFALDDPQAAADMILDNDRSCRKN
jgi:uridine kinase